MRWWQARRPNRMFFNRDNSWICFQSEIGFSGTYVLAIIGIQKFTRRPLLSPDRPASPSRILAECAVTFIDVADYRSLGVFDRSIVAIVDNRARHPTED